MEGLAVEKLLSLLEFGGPWAIVFFIWWQGVKESKRWEARFQAVKRMYEDNVVLVKGYEKLSNDQQELIIMNTQAITKLTTIIKERIKT